MFITCQVTKYLFIISPDVFRSRTKEVILAGEPEGNDTRRMLDELRKAFRPFTSTLAVSESYSDLKNTAPFTESYKALNEKATAYICDNFTCMAPITDIEEFKSILLSWNTKNI